MDIVLDPDTVTDVEDPFVLDVRIVTDLGPGDRAAPCSTNDGCAATCASSCISN
jgi:FxLD family lantipeptide